MYATEIYSENDFHAESSSQIFINVYSKPSGNTSLRMKVPTLMAYGWNASAELLTELLKGFAKLGALLLYFTNQ